MRIVHDEYPSLLVAQDGPVATISLRSPEQLSDEAAVSAEIHSELGDLFSRLRGANDVRVIVVTGAEDGVFLRQRKRSAYGNAVGRTNQSDPARSWQVFMGIARCLEGVTAIEKPVVAKVNGDALGFGQSIMFACDLIIARQDATICDNHMETEEDGDGRGSPYGLVPGDGGLALVPSYFSPAKAKEYLMLSKEYSAAELAKLGLINHAVPANKLDSTTDDIVDRLLSRAPYALAWTKRVANRTLVREMLEKLDAGAAYETVNFLQAEQLGGTNPTHLM